MKNASWQHWTDPPLCLLLVAVGVAAAIAAGGLAATVPIKTVCGLKNKLFCCFLLFFFKPPPPNEIRMDAHTRGRKIRKNIKSHLQFFPGFKGVFLCDHGESTHSFFSSMNFMFCSSSRSPSSTLGTIVQSWTAQGAQKFASVQKCPQNRSVLFGIFEKPVVFLEKYFYLPCRRVDRFGLATR